MKNFEVIFEFGDVDNYESGKNSNYVISYDDSLDYALSLSSLSDDDLYKIIKRLNNISSRCLRMLYVRSSNRLSNSD